MKRKSTCSSASKIHRDDWAVENKFVNEEGVTLVFRRHDSRTNAGQKNYDLAQPFWLIKRGQRIQTQENERQRHEGADENEFFSGQSKKEHWQKII